MIHRPTAGRLDNWSQNIKISVRLRSNQLFNKSTLFKKYLFLKPALESKNYHEFIAGIGILMKYRDSYRNRYKIWYRPINYLFFPVNDKTNKVGVPSTIPCCLLPRVSAFGVERLSHPNSVVATEELVFPHHYRRAFFHFPAINTIFC